MDMNLGNLTQEQKLAALQQLLAGDTSLLRTAAASDGRIAAAVNAAAPKRGRKRGDSWVELMFKDEDVLNAVANYLDVEPNFETVVEAMGEKIEEAGSASTSATMDGPNDGANVKLRVIITHEHVKARSSIENRIDGVLAAESQKALTAAVKKAEDTIKRGGVLSDSSIKDYEAKLEKAKSQRASSLEAASDGPPDVEEAAELPPPPPAE